MGAEAVVASDDHDSEAPGFINKFGGFQNDDGWTLVGLAGYSFDQIRVLA